VSGGRGEKRREGRNEEGGDGKGRYGKEREGEEYGRSRCSL